MTLGNETLCNKLPSFTLRLVGSPNVARFPYSHLCINDLEKESLDSRLLPWAIFFKSDVFDVFYGKLALAEQIEILSVLPQGSQGVKNGVCSADNVCTQTTRD